MGFFDDVAAAVDSAGQSVGNATGVRLNQDSLDVVGGAMFGGIGAALGGLDMLKRNLIDNPAKKAKELADSQVKANNDLIAQQAEATRKNELTLTRDRQRIAGMARSRSMQSSPNNFTSPLGVTGGDSSPGKTLLGS